VSLTLIGQEVKNNIAENSFALGHESNKYLSMANQLTECLTALKIVHFSQLNQYFKADQTCFLLFVLVICILDYKLLSEL